MSKHTYNHRTRTITGAKEQIPGTQIELVEEEIPSTKMENKEEEEAPTIDNMN